MSDVPIEMNLVHPHRLGTPPLLCHPSFMPNYSSSAKEVLNTYLSTGRTSSYAEFDFDDDFPTDRPVEVAAIAGVSKLVKVILILTISFS